jgi:hypothetical protein
MTELSQAIISGKIQAPGMHNPELSPQLEAIILKALSSNREQRYEDAALMAQELRFINLQPPVLPVASPPSLSLSGLMSLGTNEPADAPLDFTGEKLIGEIEQEPRQLLSAKQANFSPTPEEVPTQDRQTVRDHLQRLFRLPARKMPPSSTDSGKESATRT